jgi:DNA-binding beta-propeller fold protein YncE
VMGNFKKELFEVGGAVLGLVLGAAGGFVFDMMRPAPREAVVYAPGSSVRSRRRLRDQLDETPRARTFTDSFVELWQDRDGFWGLGTFWGGVIVFFAIFVLLFSSIFTNWAGIREGLIGSITYWAEQHGVQRGNQPWFYYLILLGVYETLPLIGGIAGIVYYLRKPTWLTTLLIWWALVALTIYSWAGEKMPWLIIHMTTPLVLLTARYMGELVTSAVRNRWEKRIAWGAFALLGLWTVHTGWPVNFERPDTPKDILVYTQTAPDVKKVMGDIERLSLEQTGNARDLGVVVQSGTWWPFSWYLRDYKNAEYPANLTAQATKPIVLIAGEDVEKNKPYLNGYTGTKYKMRWWYPEDYRSLKGSSFGDLLTKKDVRDGLWKWLVYRETTQPLGSYDFYVYIKDGVFSGVGSGSAAAPGGTAAPRVDPALYTSKTVPLVMANQFGTNGRGNGQLNTPRGVALDSQGNVYVADTLNHRIEKFNRAGQALTTWGTEGSGDGQFKEPMGVAVDAQGNVFVADTWNHRVQKFDSTGKFVSKWNGQPGFWGPRAIAVDGQGNVYVTDTGNKRIQKFDGTGKFLGQFGTEGTGPGQFREPIGLAVSSDGQMFVADTNNRRIQQLDSSGKFVAEWPVAGWAGGARNEPYITLDLEGNLLATDPPNNRIVKYSPTGEVLAVGGTGGKANGQFDLPLGIAAGDAIYVVDSGNHRVEVVSFGQ